MANRTGNDWYEKAAEAIIRQGKSLFQVVNHDLNLGITAAECANIQRTKAFQEVLRTQRNLYYKELATDPSRSKNAAVGQLVYAIQQLLEAGNYDKAVTAILALAKIENWTTEGASVNVFNDMTAKDFDLMRKKLGRPAK